MYLRVLSGLLTLRVTRGPHGRDACASTRRDREDRQLEPVVGLQASELLACTLCTIEDHRHTDYDFRKH